MLACNMIYNALLWYTGEAEALAPIEHAHDDVLRAVG